MVERENKRSLKKLGGMELKSEAQLVGNMEKLSHVMRLTNTPQIAHTHAYA